jgi:hypothetical protein
MYKLQTNFFGGDATFIQDFAEFDTFGKALDYVLNNKPPDEFEWNVRENGIGSAIIWTQYAGERVHAIIDGKLATVRENLIKLLIAEEYGFRDWYAELTKDGYDALIKRWMTLKGRPCSVPVPFIITGAVLLDDARKEDPAYTHRCHIHECEDSYLQGCDYQIPDDRSFWMNGQEYTPEDGYKLYDLWENDRKGFYAYRWK